MATVEIEESELANLRRVNKVAEALGKDPKTRATLQAMVAEKLPDEVGPEHHIRAEFAGRFNAIEEELRKDREGREEEARKAKEERDKEREEQQAEAGKRAIEQRWVEGRTKAREQGYMAEGLDQLEEFMEKHGIADHTLAIPAFERTRPPPEAVITGGTKWNFFDVQHAAEGDAAMKDLLAGNDEAFLARAVPSALKEVRGP